ncbi:FAD-binding protein [Nocardioides marmoriginsengisoli]|uniref:FAD-binding protein n=1 Tax=Nocardioides marmoriginsengisoli TaxID=661483 RepID=A0A3N0CPQ3_9ACTN|nr:D-arabinono-1,4-lactone oxidase [Nocardioides marmoriginsengisoli]RNL64873.1 FAD-binding protein [Nocardioides marmoriginsengisoli]
MSTEWRNWSGLTTTTPSEVIRPAGVADVVAATERARELGTTVKMPGTGHSFTGIAAPEGIRLDPAGMSGLIAVDAENLTVTAHAGTPLHVLNAALESHGLSLHNMGDIAEQTIAGATSTGTHGTGGLVASLSAQIAGLELVTGTGETLRADADTNPDVFAVARLGLGALGILTSITFKVEPMFTLEAHEFPMLWDEAIARFDELTEQNHHAEMYWFPHTDRILAKENNRTLDEPAPLGKVRHWVDDELLSNKLFGLVNRIGNLRPSLIPRMSNLAGQALSERTYSDAPHRVFTSSRSVVFREMEYAVPREVGLAALQDVRRWIDASGISISFPIEVRTTPADDIALSTSSGRDSMYLAFHMNAQTDHTAYFKGVEDILRGYDGRPHWGKLNTRTAADLAPAYPRWEEFQKLRDRLDPDRIFSNTYLRRVLGD